MKHDGVRPNHLPPSQIRYRDVQRRRGNGGVDPPASWKTSSANFNLISPQSDISAPSRIAYRHQRHQYESRRRLSQQIAPPTIQEESRDDSVGGDRRNARYRGQRPSTDNSARRRRSRSAPPTRQQRFKEQTKRAKEAFMGCVEESAHKVETVKDEALVPAAQKVKTDALVPAAKKIKSGLKVTGKAGKRYSKAAVKNLRDRHVMKKVKSIPSKTVGNCVAERPRHVDAYGDDHLNERRRGLYNDDERMLRYSSDSAEDRRDMQLQMNQEHYRNMQECIRMMEQTDISNKQQQQKPLEKAKSQESRVSTKASALSKVESKDCSSLHMMHLEGANSAEMALHHEDSYFKRLASAKTSPPVSQNAIGARNAHYMSSPESQSSPIASLFTGGDKRKDQKPQDVGHDGGVVAVSKQQKQGTLAREEITRGRSHSKPRSQNIHRSKSNDVVERSNTARHPVSKKGHDMANHDVRKTKSHDQVKRPGKPNMRVSTHASYKLDTTWLKLTPDGQPMLMSSKADAAKKSRANPQSSLVHNKESSVPAIVQNETAPSVLEEATSSISHNLSLRQTESAPSVIETHKPVSQKSGHVERKEKQTRKPDTNAADKPAKLTTEASSKKAETLPVSSRQSTRHQVATEVLRQTVKNPVKRDLVKATEVPNESVSRKTMKERISQERKETKDSLSPPQASDKTRALAIYSPTHDSLLDGSVSYPPVSDQALSNAAFLFSPSYAHGAVNIVHPPSLTRESHFAITTSASRNRLTNLALRTRPTFSIPAKSYNAIESPSVAQTSSYDDSTTTGGSVFRTKSSQGSSNKQVRFSDGSKTSSKKSTDHPKDVKLPAVESELSDLSDNTRQTASSTVYSGKDPVHEEARVSNREKVSLSSQPSNVELPTVESKLSDLSENTRQTNLSTKPLKKAPVKEDASDCDAEKASLSSHPKVSGWSYRESADGNLSSVTPVIGKIEGATNPTTSPMKRFYAAKHKFANPPAKHTPAKKTPPKKFARRSPKYGLVSSRITELDVRIKNTEQPKDVRRDTGGHGVIAPRPAKLKNPIFSRKHDDIDDEQKPKETAVLEQSGDLLETEDSQEEVFTEISPTSTEGASDIFTHLRTSNAQDDDQESGDTQKIEDEESVLSDEAQELFDQIVSNPSIDTSEAPSVSTLRRRFSTNDESVIPSASTLTKEVKHPPRVQTQGSYDIEDHSIADETFISEKEAESVSTYSQSFSYAPSFGSFAPVNPREQRQHHVNATPENLCLSPVQRTPMQARKWRTLAAEAKERDLAKKGNGKSASKSRKAAFKERSLNVF